MPSPSAQTHLPLLRRGRCHQLGLSHVVLTGPPAKQGRSHVPPWGRREPSRSSGLRPQHCCRGSPPVWRNGSDWRSWRSPGRCCRDSGQGWGAMDLELRLGRRDLPGCTEPDCKTHPGPPGLALHPPQGPSAPGVLISAPPPGRHRVGPPERGMKLAACVVCEAADLGNLHSPSSFPLSLESRGQEPFPWPRPHFWAVGCLSSIATVLVFSLDLQYVVTE